MPLKKLRCVNFINNLDNEVSDVIVLYSESKKSIHNLFNLAFVVSGKVDVETSKNILWNRESSFPNAIKPSQTCTISAANICFGDNFGYWQLYFKYDKSTYKLEKNDLRMNLSPECNDQDLKITLSSSSSSRNDIRATFEIEAVELKVEFKVIKGMPTATGMSITIHNNLENIIDYVNLLIFERITSNSCQESESKNISLKETRIEGLGQTASLKRFSFNCQGCKHDIRLCFTYLNDIYEIDKTPIKLTEKSYGDSMNIYIYQSKNEVMVKIRTNEEEKKLSTDNENLIEKRNRIFNQAIEIKGQEFLMYADQLQAVLYKLTTYAEYIKGMLIVEDDEPFFISSSENYLNEESIDGKKFMITTTLGCGVDTWQYFEEFISKLNLLKIEWNKLKELLSNLNKSLEMVDKDDRLNAIADDILMVQSMHMTEVLCNVLIPTGLDEIGLTFNISSCELKNISINPGKLLSALQQELNFWKRSIFSDGKLSHQDIRDHFTTLIYYQNNLIRLSELFQHTRVELIDKLSNVASKLHKKNRNINITMVTASSAGIFGAGMAVAGLVLIPFTAGISLTLLASGIATGVASGAVGVGTTITDEVLTKQYLNSTASLAVIDHHICNLIDKLKPLIERQSNLVITHGVSLNLPEFDDNSYHKMKSIVENISGAIFNVGATTLKATVCAVKTVGARVGSVVLGVVFDLTELTFNSINLSKGGYSELGYKLEADALMLHQELEEHRSGMISLKNCKRDQEIKLETMHPFFKI